MYSPGDDKEFDRLSKEAADHYEVPGNPSWNKLLTELDHVMPAEKKRRRKLLIFWWLLPCLLAGIPAYLWLHNQPSKQNMADAAAPGAKTLPVQASAGKAESGTTIKTHPPSTTTEDQQTSSIQLNKISANQKNILNPVTRSSSSAINAAVLPATVLPAEKSVDAKPVDVKNSQVQKQDNNTASRENSNPVDTSGKHSNTVTAEPITTAKTDSANNAIAANDTVREAKKPARNNMQRRKFSIGIVTGADLSNVKFKRASQAGYNAGLIAGYHFSNRWSVHTGAIYTRKNYEMDGADFTAPKGSPPSYWNLKTVEGDCSMWEVPLFARYSFGNKVNRRFFATAGLSSYFMTNENYDYYYPSPSTGLIVKRSGSYDWGDTHWLSIAHFSAGLEQPVGRNLSMLFEPYIKLPLTGLGVGSIKLSSIGLNVSVQFRGSKPK